MGGAKDRRDMLVKYIFQTSLSILIQFAFINFPLHFRTRFLSGCAVL